MDIKSLKIKKNIIFFIGLIIIFIFFYKISDIVLLFFIGFVLASALNPLINRLEKKMPRGIAVTLAFIAGFIILVSIIIPLINVLISQGSLFIKNAPAYWAKIDVIRAKYAVLSENSAFIPSLSSVINRLYLYSSQLLSKSLDFTISIASSLGILIALLLIIFLMLSDKEHLKQSFLDFFPDEMRAKAEDISTNISKKVGGYVIGQLLSMIATGLLTSIGLIIAGIDYAILLGIITGAMDIVPLIGPVIALSLAILSALSENPALIIWVLVVFGIVQWLGNEFIRPIIFSKTLNLHPLVILFSLIVAGKLIGVVGVIIAPAIAATIQVLIQELYINQIRAKTET